MGNCCCFNLGDGDPVVKLDPWSQTFLTKEDFLTLWRGVYPTQDLLDCWLTLRGPRRWDPWSHAFMEKPAFMARWSKEFPNTRELEKCWSTLDAEPQPYPCFEHWPIRHQALEILEEAPPARTFAVVSLIYGASQDGGRRTRRDLNILRISTSQDSEITARCCFR